MTTAALPPLQQPAVLRKKSVQRLMPGDDVDAAANTLASAYSSDPLLRYIFDAAADEDITSRNKDLFRAVLTYHLSRREGRAVVHTDAETGVVAVWQENGAWRAGSRDFFRLLPSFLRTFGLNTRARSTANRLEAQHPRDKSHVHLQLFGAEKSAQKDHASSKVIQRMLDRLDVYRLAAYVETANPEDIGFYELHGFKVSHEVSLRPGAPRVVGMWRDPQP